MKQVYSRKVTISNTGNNDDLFIASKTWLNEIRDEHPEWENHYWSWLLTSYTDGVATIEITVTDRTDPDSPAWKENLKVAVAIVILGTILFFIAINS